MTEVIERGVFEDSLVCGSCQSYFPFGNFVNFVQHKKTNCEELTTEKVNDLVCQSCPSVFGTAWSLLRHAQKVHALKIYLEKSSEELVKVQESQKAPIDKTQVIATCLKGLETTKRGLDDPKEFENVTQEFDKSDSRKIRRKADMSEAPVLADSTYASSQNFQLPESTHDVQKAGKFSEVFSDDVLDGSERSTEQKERNDMSIQLEIVDNDDDSGTVRSTKPEVSCIPTDCKAPSIPLQRVLDTTFKKCCSSVVPKKRKRHIEMKHMTVGIGSGSSKTRRRLTSPVEGPTSIYIDFEPQNEYRGKCNVEPSYGQRVFYGADSESCESNGQHIDKSQECCNESENRSGLTGSRPIPISHTANAPPLIPIYDASVRAFPLPMPENVVPDVAAERKTWNYDRFGQPTEDRDVRQVHMDQGESRSFLIELPLYPQVSVSEMSGLSEREMGFGSSRGSDGQGQKKRRYPTSRPFKCDKCEDSFNQRIHLQKHQSKHTGVKPFKCDRCDYSTVERSHLKVHIRVHTGEKPYKCTFCGYATAQNSTLKIHLKRHHLTAEGSSIFTCSTCGLHFQHRDLFANHAVQEHSQTGNSDSEETSNLDVTGQSSSVSDRSQSTGHQTK